MLRSRGPLAYILILIAETESHIRGLDDVEQGGLSIRMVAGYREAAERKILLVAEACGVDLGTKARAIRGPSFQPRDVL